VFSSYVRDHIEDPGTDGRIILKWIFRNWKWGMDWITVAQGRHGRRAVMKQTMKFQFA